MASVAEFSDSQVKATAAGDVLGAVGLILPALEAPAVAVLEDARCRRVRHVEDAVGGREPRIVGVTFPETAPNGEGIDRAERLGEPQPVQDPDGIRAEGLHRRRMPGGFSRRRLRRRGRRRPRRRSPSPRARWGTRRRRAHPAMVDRWARCADGHPHDDRRVDGVIGRLGADDHDGRGAVGDGPVLPAHRANVLARQAKQLAIGLFVATFAHAMLAMREVQFGGDGKVPGIAVAVAYVLVLTSIAMLVMYVHHIGRSLRVSALIELVGNDTRRLLDEFYPDVMSAEEPDEHEILAPRSGVLIAVDRQRLIGIATAADCILHVVPAVGGFVPAGATLIRVEGDPRHLDREGALAALHSGLERTLDEDVAYGFRMLVDMGERSLSESAFLDPTTAVQCIDGLHDGLRQLANRRLPDGSLHDDEGHVRVTIPAMSWAAYVHLAFDELRLAGASSPQVSRRLVAALCDLPEVAPVERRAVLADQLRLLTAEIRHSDRDDADREMAAEPDGQGIGAALNGDRRSR